ncbi:hypothetical protein GLX30_13420 [Streptomyces sp. Tu 2975]|uniref:hypothetical protein n=1 Tax=Streptomyces sp. Tu 2975 TaxID=2676871 RepID=UPI0013573721|nr:hypothetical protein [Streptomyces sp. Tu 2975]QIP82721.1 hypothetical protein GLX30_13420 [Streptomyces sp. Tu 2975]
MRNPIAHALGRVLIPALLRLLTLTLPPTGRHREAPAACTPRLDRPAFRPPRVFVRRSPYAREQHTILDGARSPLARPYVAASSCPAAQRRRRRALWPATVGVDIGHRNIHAVGGAW